MRYTRHSKPNAHGRPMDPSDPTGGAQVNAAVAPRYTQPGYFRLTLLRLAAKPSRGIDRVLLAWKQELNPQIMQIFK